MKKKSKQIIIKKNGTTSDYTFDVSNNDLIDTVSDTTNITTDTYKTQKNIKKIYMSNSKSQPKSNSKSNLKSKSAPKERRFDKINTSTYKKPKNGSNQDNYTKEEILKQLKGYIPLTTLEEKKILTELPIFKTWIKYINLNNKQFRSGGFLMKVQYPDYITLVNTKYNTMWSVQLNKSIIYIRDPRLKQQKQIPITKIEKENTEETINNKKDETSEYYDTDSYYTETYTYTDTYTANKEIEMIKDKLYKLFIKGQLTTKK
jgi:hypothetical protein